MMIRPAELAAIRAGQVDLAFRRWERPRVVVGTRMRTAVGLLEVTAVDQVEVGEISDDDVRRAGAPSREALLRALEARSEHPVWRVGLRYAGPDPRVALRESVPDAGEVAEITARLDRLDKDAEAVGMVLEHRFATWHLDPFTEAADFAVSVLRVP